MQLLLCKREAGRLEVELEKARPLRVKPARVEKVAEGGQSRCLSSMETRKSWAIRSLRIDFQVKKACSAART